MSSMMVFGDRRPWGPSQSWGSGGHRHWRVWVVGRQELLPEIGAERAVVEGAADLEQPIGPAPGPAHLLRLDHATVHQEVGRALGQRRADPLPGPVPFDVIDQMGARGAPITVHRVAPPPQLASGLVLEGGQECMNAIDADLRVLGLAV